MPWRAQSQPFQTVRNLPFVRRDLVPCRCFREIVDATDGLTYEIRWILVWLQLEPATSWIHPLMSAALLPVISQIRLPVWSARPPIIYYGNGKSPICRWFSYMIPIKCVFFSFFSIAMLNYQRIYCCWTYPHAGSVTRFRLWAYKIYTKNLAKVPCLVASTSISARFHYHLLLLVGGIPTPLKNLKVSWDDDIPNIWKIKHVPNHQPGFNL